MRVGLAPLVAQKGSIRDEMEVVADLDGAYRTTTSRVLKELVTKGQGGGGTRAAETDSKKTDGPPLTGRRAVLHKMR